MQRETMEEMLGKDWKKTRMDENVNKQIGEETKEEKSDALRTLKAILKTHPEVAVGYEKITLSHKLPYNIIQTSMTLYFFFFVYTPLKIIWREIYLYLYLFFVYYKNLEK